MAALPTPSGDWALQIRGLAEAQAAILRVAAAAPQAAAAVLYQEASAIQKEAAELAPIDTGTLAASGKVVEIKDAGGVVGVKVGFGEGAEPYALAVHEHLSSHSPYSWIVAEGSGGGVEFHPTGQGRGPKYLERPFLTHLPGLPAKIAAAVEAALVKARSAFGIK